MTRAEFDTNVNDWYDLLEFCRDENLDVCESIYDSDALDEIIQEDLRYAVNDAGYSWQDIYSYLDDISTGYDYYCVNGTLDYDPMNDGDFEYYRNEVIEAMDGYWDEEWEPEDDETFVMSSEEDEPAPEEDISIFELMAFAQSQILA